MKKSFWISTVFAVILVVFSVQNASEVPVSLFFKEVQISLAVLLITVFIFGAITGASYFFFKRRQENKRITKPQEEEIITENESEN